jgi:hypothetical protein
MKYYKGACDQDVPYNGGKFVKEHGFGHEEYNFLPITLVGLNQEMCFGFVEPKSNKGARNTLHIEKIYGCSALKNEESVDNVLIIWCATRLEGDVTVVGWYKDATVFRRLQDWTMRTPDGTEENRHYNVLAETSNCTLLPESERNRHIWSVPNARYTKSFGFGQSMLWYPTEETAKIYLERLLHSIDSYKGDNWINKYPN